MADQKQWPEVVISRDAKGRPYIVSPNSPGTSPTAKTYVPLVRLQEAEASLASERERLAKRLEDVDDALVVLVDRRRRAGKWDSVAYLQGRQHECRNQAAALRGISTADGPWNDERDKRHRAILEAALSPSPVEGQECPACSGSGKKTHVGTAGHAVTIACSDCHGTGKKQPEAMEDLSAAADRSDNLAIPGHKPDPEERRELTVPGCINCGLPTTSCTCKGNLGWRGEVRIAVLEVIDKTPKPDSNKEADR